MTKKSKTTGKNDQSQQQPLPRKPTIKIDSNPAISNGDTLKNVQFGGDAQGVADDPSVGYVPPHMLAQRTE